MDESDEEEQFEEEHTEGAIAGCEGACVGEHEAEVHAVTATDTSRGVMPAGGCAGGPYGPRCEELSEEGMTAEADRSPPDLVVGGGGGDDSMVRWRGESRMQWMLLVGERGLED